jgi:hypothetical protein
MIAAPASLQQSPVCVAHSSEDLLKLAQTRLQIAWAVF